MAPPQLPLSSGAVAEWLLDNGLLLTALELLHEMPEAVTAAARSPAAAHLLQRYFTDVRRFPPAALAKCEHPDVGSHKALLKGRDEQISLLDYELRLAKEDVGELKERVQRLAQQPAGGEAGGVPVPQLGGVPHDAVERGPGDAERRMLNFAVKQHLVARGYKLSALTFCEEVRDQQLDVWDGAGTLPREPLWALYLAAAKLGGGLQTEHIAALQAATSEAEAREAAAAAAVASEREQAAWALTQQVRELQTQLQALRRSSASDGQLVEMEQRLAAAKAVRTHHPRGSLPPELLSAQQPAPRSTFAGSSSGSSGHPTRHAAPPPPLACVPSRLGSRSAS